VWEVKSDYYREREEVILKMLMPIAYCLLDWVVITMETSPTLSFSSNTQSITPSGP
jgi:hypothetical protein